MEDIEIIQALFARDERGIDAVQSAYGSYCAAIVRRVLDSPEDVEEVLSDTWLRAWNSIPPRRPDNLKLYLARIARNLSYDRFRTQTRQKRGGAEISLALQELSACIPAPGQPGDGLEADELKQAVNVFLSAQPKRDRGIFLLRYFYLEDTEAIAERFGIRPGLVRTSLSRTRKKLRAHLQKEGLLG